MWFLFGPGGLLTTVGQDSGKSENHNHRHYLLSEFLMKFIFQLLYFFLIHVI